MPSIAGGALPGAGETVTVRLGDASAPSGVHVSRDTKGLLLRAFDRTSSSTIVRVGDPRAGGGAPALVQALSRIATPSAVTSVGRWDGASITRGPSIIFSGSAQRAAAPVADALSAAADVLESLRRSGLLKLAS